MPLREHVGTLFAIIDERDIFIPTLRNTPRCFLLVVDRNAPLSKRTEPTPHKVFQDVRYVTTYTSAGISPRGMAANKGAEPVFLVVNVLVGRAFVPDSDTPLSPWHGVRGYISRR
jgi:hypothetical protein